MPLSRTAQTGGESDSEFFEVKGLRTQVDKKQLGTETQFLGASNHSKRFDFIFFRYTSR